LFKEKSVRRRIKRWSVKLEVMMSYLKRSFLFSMCVVLFCTGFFGRKTLKVEHLGKIKDCQGVSALRPAVQERWTPLAEGLFVDAGDLIRSEKRGANAVQVRFSNGGGVIIGPGSLVEFTEPGKLKIIRGEVEVESPAKKMLTLVLPNDKQEKVQGIVIFRVTETSCNKLELAPPWLNYFKGALAQEPMGSLLATVEGRNLPLTLGYHKVTVDIRDQIARTTVEESFVNNTSGTLEGVFHFPLPQDASISGFGMWINNELVEADVVEKQRAREIYETILRERRDPGLLEWSGGNIFKARVFPIFGHSEKRIKITYTQVLPLENGVYKYSYALQSEMLKQFPLRDLEVKVNIHSEQPLKTVVCPTHETRLTQSKNGAQVEFFAQEYTPSRDFEVFVETGKVPEVVVIPHRRGEDGYFLLQVAQPDAGNQGGRQLIKDGPALDLVVMADTSASMDSEQRKVQEEFIACLMGALGSKDRMRVAAVDMDCHWVSGDDSEAVRDFLSHRASLGATDLEKVFAKVFAESTPTTQIIYLGDCVDTTREADPVDTARRLKSLYQANGKGCIHAVATGSSFESGVMKALAGMSNGSMRRLQGNTPARTGVMELLEELTSPGIREMKIDFSGVRVARVYPGELPNLPAGKQQIILGRYLPDGKDQSGSVTVTGTYKGKAVSYQAPFKVKDAESGNSFIPRLWARMHLDTLLEQGGTQEIKDEVIALSEEYHIMTPYTSFLVLESDADRERFKVTRRFTMRDGEKFFAEGREKADYELRQKTMQLAGTWRQDLRRDILRELLDLGRQYYNVATPYQETYGFTGGVCGVMPRVDYARSMSPVGRASLKSGVDHSFWADGVSDDYSEVSPDGSDRVGNDEDMDAFFDTDAPGDKQRGEPYPEEPTSDSEMKEEKRKEMAASPAPRRAMELRNSMQYSFDSIGPSLFGKSRRMISSESLSNFKPNINGPTGFDQLMMVGAKGLVRDGWKGRRENAEGYSSYGGYSWHPYWNNWIEQIFPSVPATAAELAVKPQPEVKPWPEQAQKLAAALLRQPVLDKMAGALEISFEALWYDARKELARKDSQKLYYSPSAWLSCSWSSSGRSLVGWSDGKTRTVYTPYFKLGRQRKAVASDAKLVVSTFGSFYDSSSGSLEESYRTYLPTITDADKGLVLLALKNPDANSDYRLEFLIDPERNVVLEERTFSQGVFTQTIVFSDFVKAGGCWLATQVEHRNREGVVSFRSTLSVKEMDNDAFKKCFAELRPKDQEAILIEQILPDYETARQAKLDGKMDLGHYFSLISFYTQTQQWEKAREVWAEAKKLVKGRAGESWINLAVYVQSRRHEEARLIVNEKAKELLEKRDIDELYIGNFLSGYVQQFAQANERLELLAILRPVYERQEAYLKSVLTWKRNHAQALSDAGRGVEALAIWKELSEAFPTDTHIVSWYTGALLQDGRMEEAYSWLMERLAREGHWNEQERESVRSSALYKFENQLDSAHWLAFLKGWIEGGTANQTAHQKYLEALYRAHRTEEAHRLVENWARSGIKVRMQAAVEQMLGQSYGCNYLDARWHTLLAEVVRGCYRVDASRSIAALIMNHTLFRNIEEAAALRKAFKQVLVAEFDALNAQTIIHLVGWLSVNDPKMEKEEWAALANRIEARWDVLEQKDPDRPVLGSALVSVLNQTGNLESVTRFLRKQWKTGPDIYKQQYLEQLYSNLLNHAWQEDIETELFTLIQAFAGKNDDPQLRLAGTVPVLMEIIEAMVKARQKASLEKVEKKEDLARTEYRKLVTMHEQQAREGMLKRLEREEERQAEQLRTWIRIERLYLEMKLGRDAGSIAAACWKLLPVEPPACKKENKNVLDAGLIDRCITTLACLAAKQSADKALVDKLSAYLDLGIERNPDSSYWRYQKYRLLVARNEPEQLEAALRSWVKPEKADDTWRLALGYLVAEMNKVEEAISLFEEIEKRDGLGQKEYAMMSGWYQLLDQKEKQKAAELKELMVIDEYQLSRRLEMILNPWYRNNDKDKVPEALDPAAIKIFTALLKKTQNLNHYNYQLRNFYRYTKDFRLLECMSEGVLGHTAAQVYPYVGGLRELLSDVREEATVDTAMAYLAQVRLNAKTRVDERALDILELMMRRRAAEVQNQPGPHSEKSLEAMKRAFKGEWQTGERRLMAELLSGLGNMTPEVLKQEQLRELKALAECQTEPAQDRLHILLQYAIIVYGYGQKEQAVELLETSLAEYREKSGRVLPSSANSALDQLISYLESLGQFVRAEAYLQRELEHPVNQQQMCWLIQRKLKMYTNAIAYKATVSLGSGQELFEKVLDLYIRELDRSDPNHRSQIISLVSDFFRRAKEAKLDVTRMRSFAFDVFPKFLEKETNQYTYQNHVSNLSTSLQSVLGAKTALEFMIVTIENEPEWLRFTHYSGWSRHSYQLGQYRSEAGAIEDLAERLLKLVKAEIRKDLTSRNQLNRLMYNKRSSYFWKEKADAFRTVAEEVWCEQKKSGATTLYIAEYMWDGLEQRERAAKILMLAYQEGLLDEAGQARLVEWLHGIGKFEESVPILEGLIKLNENQVRYRVQMMTVCFFRTNRPERQREVLVAADRHFHQPGKWVEDVVYQLAKGCLDVQYYKESVAYYLELIQMHKRSHPERGVGSSELSRYYRELSQAYAGLKMTAEAVDAASGAVITWGRSNSNRAEALQALERVVQNAPDLDDYAKKIEADAKASGLENPLVRKAIGKAYLSRNNYEAAIQHLKAAAEAQPNDTEIHQSLLEAYDRMGDKAGAVAQLLESVKLSRRDIQLYKSLGERYAKQLKNEVESERAYMSMVEMLPNESESHTLLAEIRQGQGRWTEAMHHWRQVARVRTLEPTGYMNLAAAQLHEKQFAEALETIKILESKSWPARFSIVENEIRIMRQRLPAK
jgi:predicted Zn-dependent protease